MMRKTVVLGLILSVAEGASIARSGTTDRHDIAPQSKYHITAQEQSACGQDAVSLCAAAYPDEDKLLACLKFNRVNLSALCRPVFEEGVRRRHLN